MKLCIFYEMIEHKPINGSLFYCFEYYKFLLDNNKDIVFIIHKSKNNKILDIFKNKYLLNENDLKNVIFTNSIKEIFKYTNNIDKILFLDTRSYKNNYPLIRTKNIYLYANNDNYNKPKSKNIKIYGYYDYQKFQYSTLLKFYFNIYPEIKKSKNNYFISSTLKNIDEKISEKFTNKYSNKYEKDVNNHLNNLFENFNTLVYIHSTLDTNNRIIIESAFYNKKIEFIDDCNIIDSSNIRYEDAINNNIKKYYLTLDDILIKDFINENI
jgi:hypothetical protein